MNTVIIRKAALADTKKLLKLEQGLIESMRFFDQNLKDEKTSFYHFETLLIDNNVQLMVAEHKGELVGSGYARITASASYEKNDYFAYLGFMYVVAEHRGKGINKKILNALINWCKSKKITEIRLDVFQKNQAAIQAYEKIGFSQNSIKMTMEI